MPLSSERIIRRITRRFGHFPSMTYSNRIFSDVNDLIWFGLIHYSAFSACEGHVTLDRNPGPGYDTLLLRMIPGDLLSAFPSRQFHTLPGLLNSWAALPNSNPNALHAYTLHAYTIFMMVFGVTRPRGELTPYRARGGHATDWANPTRFDLI